MSQTTLQHHAITKAGLKDEPAKIRSAEGGASLKQMSLLGLQLGVAIAFSDSNHLQFQWGSCLDMFGI